MMATAPPSKRALSPIETRLLYNLLSRLLNEMPLTAAAFVPLTETRKHVAVMVADDEVR
jgi:hypothetical protein